MQKLENLVQRVYIVDTFYKTATRGLVDKHGLVFRSGDGWSSKRDHERIVRLPGSQREHRDWDHTGWWTANWHDPTWAWCYMYRSPSRWWKDKVPERSLRKLKEKHLREEKQFERFMRETCSNTD